MAPRGPERCEGNAGKWREGDSYSAMAPRGPERLLFHPSRSENPNHQSSDYRASIGRGAGRGGFLLCHGTARTGAVGRKRWKAE